MEKVAFNKENPVDLFSQLIKVLSRYEDSDMQMKTAQLRELSKEIFELTHGTPMLVASIADEIIKTSKQC